ncbi:MAG TPA: hypothetical protein VHZ76_00795 [Gammaproteobacteria bacterium]|jgi:hypothetical protein|nr:hypothetical protein [Gammaproteobacteria bacterium]
MSIFTFHENYFTWKDEDDDRCLVHKKSLNIITIRHDKKQLKLHCLHTFRSMGPLGMMANDTFGLKIKPDTCDEIIESFKKYYGEDAFVEVTGSDKDNPCALVLIRKSQIVGLIEYDRRGVGVITRSGQQFACTKKFDDLFELLNH